MESADCVVIGAGVVGLAAAREMALAGREVIVLEAAGAIGTETSSRNSEVIHAGLYYAPGSLKTRFCVEGRKRLYAYCMERGIDARAIGKLLVATDQSQIQKLEAIKANAQASGVMNLEWRTPPQVSSLEPEVQCVAAVFSPSSGILDSHAFMLALQGDLENAGGVVALNCPVLRGKAEEGCIVTWAQGLEMKANIVVNAAGLHAPTVARTIGGMPA